ncbi:radical SAM protein [Pectinatus sottacetonis]|uniref:radical SAM protein n=1 Tax=Pectinatus sottacetonis TaxID=1002795 RepID=UPI0018C5CE3A|nr:radical SAM protein [Pectinatus sottacetonis]
MDTVKITALYADENGGIFDAPGVAAMGRSGKENIVLKKRDLILLPDDAVFMYLPGRMTLGQRNGEIIPISGQAVAAVLPKEYIRGYLPSFYKEETAVQLPSYAYTAVGLYKEQIYAAALYTDEKKKTVRNSYDIEALNVSVKKVKNALPDNRLVCWLADCALKQQEQATDLFYHRKVVTIPMSDAYNNTACLGCDLISEEIQKPLNFIPTTEEITQIGIYYFEHVKDGILNFGCGGNTDPALMAEKLAAAIGKIREKTAGHINIRTNAGCTTGIAKLADAGLDSMTVDIISAVPENYQTYFNCNYELADVVKSLIYAREKGVVITLNMLYFPGFNDNKSEALNWRKFLRKIPVDRICICDLNIDPDLFTRVMPMLDRALGTKMFFGGLKGEFSAIRIPQLFRYKNN